MSCCTSFINICDINSCDQWIITTVPEPNTVTLEDPIPFDAAVKFNGVQLSPEKSFQNGFLAIKNSFAPNYTYELKVTSHNKIDPVIYCFRFNIIQNINI